MRLNHDIVLSPFAEKRHTDKSHLSHWTITNEDFTVRIKDAIDKLQYSQGYRDGVMLVHLFEDEDFNPGEFLTGLVALKEGDVLTGEYKARQPGETPRKQVCVKSGQPKLNAKAVDVILYHHDVLVETNEQSCDNDWEIISVNARTTLSSQPINPMTLMHNHFGSDGGTDTHMSPEQFEDALRKSFKYWKGRAFLAPKE
jgi:hypothetical protein